MLIVETTNVFDASAWVELSIIDATPYDPANEVNDCKGDGNGADAGVEDRDGNDNVIQGRPGQGHP